MTAEELRSKQEAGTDVEKKMLEWLMQYGPADGLKVEDIKAIAFAARRMAFDAFLETK